MKSDATYNVTLNTSTVPEGFVVATGHTFRHTSNMTLFIKLLKDAMTLCDPCGTKALQSRLSPWTQTYFHQGRLTGGTSMLHLSTMVTPCFPSSARWAILVTRSWGCSTIWTVRALSGPTVAFQAKDQQFRDNSDDPSREYSEGG